MRRIILSVIFTVSVVLSATAQDLKVEPGRAEKLKGVVRIHLQTEEERARRYIVREGK